ARAAAPSVLLARPLRPPRRDQHLLANEIEARCELGDRVLDLDARVHLEEEVLAVPREQTLDRAGRSVSDRPGRVDRDLADALAEVLGHRRRRRLLDQRLVPALNRAIALTQVNDV